MSPLSEPMILNITYQSGNRPYIWNRFPSPMSQCQTWEAQHSYSGRHHGAAGDTKVHYSVCPPCFPGKISPIRASLARWPALSRPRHQTSPWSAVCWCPSHGHLYFQHFFPDLGTHYPMQFTYSLTNCSHCMLSLFWLLMYLKDACAPVQ